ncbi:MAG: formyltetrahydrofolate deformylase, partial [Pricia sp.]|nr:formyltetrahydrofolate deformylase [Pricia sp.]
MRITLLIHCPDQSGIISAVTGFVHNHRGNIVYLDQHVDKEANVFFMRLQSDFDGENFSISSFKEKFQKKLAKTYEMEWSMHQDGTIPKMALFVSKYNHCLYDLLSRFRSGELEVDIPFILSNHLELKSIAEQFAIPFYHIPVTKKTREEAENAQLQLLTEHKIDFIVLARYMQIVSQKILDYYPNKIINIHHSFLPAFAGAKPYH